MYVTMKNACNLFKANCAQLLKKKREFPLFSAQKFMVKFVVKNGEKNLLGLDEGGGVKIFLAAERGVKISYRICRGGQKI